MRAMTKMAAPRLTILTKLATLAIFCQFRQISSSKGNDTTWVNIGDFGEFVQPLVAKLSFSPCLPHSPTVMGPLHCFIALCFASLAIVAKLSFSPNLPHSPSFMGPLIASLLCALPRWRLWQNCHFCLICLIRLLLRAPSLLHCFVLCLAGDCGKIVIFALFAKFAFFYGPPHCFIALCFASLAIVAKLSFSPYLPNLPHSPSFMGPLIASLLCALPRWRLWQNCFFLHICQICQLLWAPSLLHCFVLCLVGDCGKNCHFRHICQICLIRLLLWDPSLLHCFVLCLVGDCGKIVFFSIFAKFASFAFFYGPPHCFIALCFDGEIVLFAIFAKFANFYGSPSLLRALPRWRFWQNCHFRHICQIC